MSEIEHPWKAALQRIADSKTHEEAVTRAKVALGQLGVGALLTIDLRAYLERKYETEGLPPREAGELDRLRLSQISEDQWDAKVKAGWKLP